MAQTAFTVRMEADTKKRFDELCRDFGMSANTAINVFARAVVREERIPFDLETEAEREKLEAAKPKAAKKPVAKPKAPAKKTETPQ